MTLGAFILRHCKPIEMLSRTKERRAERKKDTKKQGFQALYQFLFQRVSSLPCLALSPRWPSIKSSVDLLPCKNMLFFTHIFRHLPTARQFVSLQAIILCESSAGRSPSYILLRASCEAFEAAAAHSRGSETERGPTLPRHSRKLFCFLPQIPIVFVFVSFLFVLFHRDSLKGGCLKKPRNGQSLHARTKKRLRRRIHPTHT